MIRERKSKHSYQIMSNTKCRECGNLLKQNVIDRNPSAKLCYICFKISKGKFEAVRRKLVNGEFQVISTVDFKQLQRENRRKNNYDKRKF